jgi:tRNA dimethylallyltransferase
MSKPPLLVIVGPTASGKSDLAMHAAQMFNGALICADSRTVYRGMDIGTAKPTPVDQEVVQHYLLDVAEPSEPFTAAQFKELAVAAIDDIVAQGKLPIMVGGTGLYIDSVLFDYTFGEPADPKRRHVLQQMSVLDLQEICRQENIEIPVNEQNKRHLIRAIEIGGLPKNNRSMRPNTLVVGIATDRDILRARIAHRAHCMLRLGIIDEIRELSQHYGWQSEAMTGNIYRVFKGVIESTKTQEQAVEEFIASDMQLAKRQITWFKRNPHIVWGHPDDLLRRMRAFVDAVKT